MTAQRCAQIGERRDSNEGKSTVNHVRLFRNSRDVVQGDDLTITSTESDLRKMRAEMCVRARGGPDGGKRTHARLTSWADLRWTDEGLEHKADKHCRELLEGFGVERGIEDSQQRGCEARRKSARRNARAGQRCNAPRREYSRRMANPTQWEKLAEMDEGRQELEARKREQQRRSGRVGALGVDEQCPRGSRQVEA